MSSQVNRTVAQLRRQFLPDFSDVTPVARARLGRHRQQPGDLVAGGRRPALADLRFDPPVDLGAIGVHSGAANADDFPTLRRPLDAWTSS